MQYYLQQAAKIRSKPEPKFDAPVAPQTASKPTSSSGLLREQSITAQQNASLSQAAKPSTQPTSNNVFQQPSIPSNINNMFNGSSTPKPNVSNTSNIFAAAQTPSQPTLSSQFSRPPATAPVNKKRPGPFTEEEDDEDAERFPATEKRARHDEPVSYPKLPQGASETAKLFQAALDKPAGMAKDGAEKQATPTSSLGGFNPSATSSLGGFNPSATSSLGGFMASASTSSEQPGAAISSIGGFKPSTAAPTTTGGFTPSASTSTAGGFKPVNATSTGFTPTNGGPPKVSRTALKSGTFLSAFGKKANAEAEEQKKKRKLDDYDSDEETEEEWAKRDEEEQKAKRQKIAEESKKASGFVFNAAAAKKSGQAVNVFGHLSQSASEASDNETDDGHADDKAEPEKALGPGDNTWNMKTPIKFGASTSGNETTTPAAPLPPSFNMFGSTPATSSAGFLGVPSSSTTKPSIGFGFLSNPGSSAGTSRASTPGITTDGEGSTAGDDEDTQPSEPQVEDQTGLRPEEIENEDLLFTCHATAKKMKTKKDDQAPTGSSKGWATVAIGPLYVLKNKETGRARVLLKVPPYGTAKMNFPVMSKMNYSVAGKRMNMVQGAFVDHIDESVPKLAAYVLEVGVEEAAVLAEVLNESRDE